MKFSHSFLPLFAFQTLVVSAMTLESRATKQRSAKAKFDGTNYIVQGVGEFNSHLSIDFATAKQIPDTLHVDDYPVGAGYAPYSRLFTTDNVNLIHGDSLSMLVPGGQNSSPILGAEIRTTVDDILYGSVRTVAKASTAAGSCHGFFFYKNDTQETDIEILTSKPGKIHFTNQAVSGHGNPSTCTSHAPEDLSSAYHEYRIDWMPGKTTFYIDGVLKRTLTENVPSIPGPWIWNNWSNGGDWTMGPPKETSDLRIRHIEGYFNRTSVTEAAANKTMTPAAHPKKSKIKEMKAAVERSLGWSKDDE